MNDEAPPPPGSLLTAGLGGIAGAAAGAAVYGVVWLLAVPGRTAAQALAHVLATGILGPPASAYAIVGAVVGFLLAGAMVRNVLALAILAALGRTFLLLLSLAAGALFGVAAYAALWIARGNAAAQAIPHILAAWGQPGEPLTLFVIAGVLAGLVGGAYALGRGFFASGTRMAAGGVVGALAGLVIYSVAYVVLFHPEATSMREYAFRLAEAMNSLAPSEILFVGIGALCGVFLSRYSWRLYGILTLVSLLFVVLGYALYTLTVTLPLVPEGQRPLSIALFVAELASLLMVLLYSFYTIDVAARKHWRRNSADAPFSPYFLPKVAIHVPTYNEPPGLVEETLRTLLSLDYPEDRYLIMVGDDSTDPACAEPLQAFCQANGIVYRHRDDRRGYKAGALNGLLERTPRDANLIAVVDADYQVEPEFLRETVGYFIDPDLGWLQTPQDYRNRHQSFLTEQYYIADAYFYRTILPSRNEENSIIFCGTMGMLRKRSLVDVGGWGEKYITEDAELSARLLNSGWKSLYINKTYGRGLIPATFDGYKRQHYRWAFGGGRILRGHLGRFLFGRFTFRQRLDYLVGTLNWFEGAFIFAIACFILLMGAAEIAGLDVVTHHSQEVLLVGLVPLFLLLDGLTRVHLVLRRSVHLGFGGTLRILGMWLSVKFSNMRAAIKGFLGFSIPFIRTPKAPTEGVSRADAFSLAVRLTRLESTMVLLLLATAAGLGVRTSLDGPEGPEFAGRIFLLFWLAYYALVFSAAPLYAYKSMATLRTGGEVLFHERPREGAAA